jgi:hypothetical protein
MPSNRLTSIVTATALALAVVPGAAFAASAPADRQSDSVTAIIEVLDLAGPEETETVNFGCAFL